MYTSPDEDRSDLFLAAAVFVIGPEILGIVLGWLPMPIGVGPILRLLVVLATTILVPFLLIRYRKQKWNDFGFAGPVPAAGLGALASVPVIAAYLVGNLVAGAGLLPMLTVRGSASAVPEIAIDVISGMATMVLVIFLVTKARTSFRTDPAYIRPTMLQLGRFAAIVAAVAAVLLLLAILSRGLGLRAGVEVLLAPVGVAAAVFIVYRAVRGSQLTSRAILLTPMVVLAIGSFRIFGDASDVVFGLWQASLLAGVGLAAAALLESSRSAWAPLGLAFGLALMTPLL
jgi:hypothetical protein